MSTTGRLRARLNFTALRTWLGEHAYLIVVVGAALVLTRTVDFSPPPQVRQDPLAHGGVVSELPVQDFTTDLRSPRVVQIKASLRRYDDRGLAVSAGSHDLDDRGELLSQPVVTTPLGTGAAIDQKVRLEGGALELDLQIFATPRLADPAAKTTLLEHELEIHSRRGELRRVHVGTRGVLADVETRGHRVVFAVDDHLFSLDLEMHRPLGAV